jgi:hypothetical protein
MRPGLSLSLADAEREALLSPPCRVADVIDVATSIRRYIASCSGMRGPAPRAACAARQPAPVCAKPRGANSHLSRTLTHMTTTYPGTPAIEALVEAMLTSCGQLATIFDHMERHRYNGPEAEAPAAVLSRLLTGILAPLPFQHAVEDVATAAQVLIAATELVASEFFLVSDDQPPDGAT